jgi:hypothetical protein
VDFSTEPINVFDAKWIAYLNIIAIAESNKEATLT